MRIQSDQLVALGYGKFVRSDDVIAVDPVVEGRGPGRRALVWVRGVPDPLVASRSEGAIADDLITPAEEAARMQQLRTTIRELTRALDSMPPMLRRLMHEETGVDVTGLVDQGHRILG
ncbi:MAG: hypothetical protein ACR2HR_03465 [Euzebya sp.]